MSLENKYKSGHGKKIRVVAEIDNKISGISDGGSLPSGYAAEFMRSLYESKKDHSVVEADIEMSKPLYIISKDGSIKYDNIEPKTPIFPISSIINTDMAQMTRPRINPMVRDITTLFNNIKPRLVTPPAEVFDVLGEAFAKQKITNAVGIKSNSKFDNNLMNFQTLRMLGGPMKNNKDRNNESDELIDISDQSKFDEGISFAQKIPQDIIRRGTRIFKRVEKNRKPPSLLDNADLDDIVDPSVNCRHNFVELNTWEVAKHYVGDLMGNGQYSCKYCNKDVICQHLKDDYDKVDINKWTNLRDGFLLCNRCSQFIEIAKTRVRGINHLSTYLPAVFYSGNTALNLVKNYLTNGFTYKNAIEDSHSQPFYDSVNTYYNYEITNRPQLIQQLSIMHGFMYCVLAIIYYITPPSPVTFKDDTVDIRLLGQSELYQNVLTNMNLIISSETYKITSPLLKSFVMNESAFNNTRNQIIKHAKAREIKPGDKAANILKDKVVLAHEYFDVYANLYKKYGLNEEGVNKTMPNLIADIRQKTIDINANIDITRSKKGIKLMRKGEFTVPYSEVFAAHSANIMEPLTLIYGCKSPKAPIKTGKAIWTLDNYDAEHIWYDPVTLTPFNKCMNCNKSLDELRGEDDAPIQYKIRTANMTKALREQYITKCPEEQYNKTYHNEHTGNPCTKCNYPDLDLHRYGHVLCRVINIQDVPAVESLTKNKIPITDSNVSQHSILDKMPIDWANSQKIAFIKNIILNSLNRFGLTIDEIESIKTTTQLTIMFHLHEKKLRDISNVLMTHFKTDAKPAEIIIDKPDELEDEAGVIEFNDTDGFEIDTLSDKNDEDGEDGED